MYIVQQYDLACVCLSMFQLCNRFVASHLIVFICCVLYSVFGCVHVLKQERETDPEEGEEEAPASHLHSLRTTASKLFQLNQAIRQLHSSLSAALRGEAYETHSPHVEQKRLSNLIYIKHITGKHPSVKSSRRNSMSRAKPVAHSLCSITISSWRFCEWPL